MSSELVNTETGEVITETDARASVDRARHHGRISFEEITWQIEHRVWELLGYSSWDAMRATEYADLRAVVPRADRPELTERMRSSGLTQQQIADTLGVHEATVSRDLANARSDQPTKIANSRGQQRPTSYQRPKPKPLPPQETQAERDARAEERSRELFCTHIAESVRYLDGGTYSAEQFLERAYPKEADYLAPGMRLTRTRVDAAIQFLQTIREGIDR